MSIRSQKAHLYPSGNDLFVKPISEHALRVLSPSKIRVHHGARGRQPLTDNVSWVMVPEAINLVKSCGRRAVT